MKKRSLLFLAACMALCLIPSVGMLFFPTTQTSENRAIAAAPQLMTDEGNLNSMFFEDCESYFNDHIALRNQLVYTDAKIQTSLFYESNVDGVVYGSNDWLYYTSTLDDYLGNDVLSDRELYNIAHNLSIIQAYLEERDSDFVFSIAPNKNTLYGENMPYYYSYIVNSNHSAKLLEPFLSEQGVCYVDLFELFENQEETLYLLRDSHWNTKGACLVYNALMDSLGREHETYSGTEPTPIIDENGDLNRMLYSFYGELEENYDYDIVQEYVHANDTNSVEDGWIVTENENGTGTLLMFRDSFANTLIPFLSNEFETVYYSKGQPNAIERYVEADTPQCVVIEIVERNITNYLNDPPILTPPTTDIPTNITIANTESSIAIQPCLYDANYYTINGKVDAERIQNDSEIVLLIGDTFYRAYQTAENGFALYVKQATFTETELPVKVYVVNGDVAVQALSTTLTLPQ